MTGEALGRYFERQEIEGRYFLKRMLAAGAFGAVFHGEHKILGRLVREVAVKITLHTHLTETDLQERFGEALASAKVYDSLAGSGVAKYLVPVHDIGILKEHEDRGFIVMGLVRGAGSNEGECFAPKTLAETILNWRATGTPGAMEYMKRICRIVGALHQLEFIHRDLKPDNILFSETGEIRLVDLGLAVELGPDAWAAGSAGTHLYMAPETGLESRSTPASDVYALGQIAYELLTGKNPFENLHVPPDFPKEMHCLWMQQNKKGAPKVRPSSHQPGIPAWQDDLVMRCLHNDPGERPRDALTLLKLIEAQVAKDAVAIDGTGLADWFTGTPDWDAETPKLEQTVGQWGGKPRNKVWLEAATKLVMRDLKIGKDLKRVKQLIPCVEEVLQQQFANYSSWETWYRGLADVMKAEGKAHEIAADFRAKQEKARSAALPAPGAR